MIIEEVDIEAKEIETGVKCFAGSPNLRKVVLHSLNVHLRYSSFANSSINSLQILYYQNIYKPNEVELSEQCFCEAKLEKIELEAYKINIGYKCFNDAKSLKEVDLDGNFITVSDKSFNCCRSLESFSISESRSSQINQELFNNCQNLKKISINVSTNYSKILNRDYLKLCPNTFKGADGLKDIEFVGGIIHITNDLISSMSLSSLSIKSAKEVIIDPNSFNQCKELSSVSINSLSLRISDNCFNNDPSLETVILKCNDIYIENGCFNNLGKCNNIEFNNVNLMYFNSDNFCHLSNLTNLDLKSTEYIITGSKCFNDLENLEKLTFHSKLVLFGQESFVNCSSLQSVISYNIVPSFLSKPFSSEIASSSNTHKIGKISIDENSFILCDNLKELKIDAEQDISISNNSFKNLKNLNKIAINCQNTFIDGSCFLECPDKGSIPSKYFHKQEVINPNLQGFNLQMQVNRNLALNQEPNKLIFKNERKFDSFYVIGIDKDKKPSFISMFPAKPVTFDNKSIKELWKHCYPNGITPIPRNPPKDSNILNGFVFYFANERGKHGYIGVVLHIYMPPGAKSFVGDKYDRNYPFCLCLLTNDPDISSHFSFLQSLVHPIVGKTKLKIEDIQIPMNLMNQQGSCIESLYIRSDNEYIALSPSAYSMSFLFPKLVNYYTAEKTQYFIRSQADYLLYPTLQTLLSYLTPSQVVELVMCAICEFQILFVSKNMNKSSFSVVALTNLLKDLDIMSVINPCMTMQYKELASPPFPYIFGFYENTSSKDKIVADLDKKQITCESNDLQIVKNFPYIQKIKKRVEKLFKDNCSKFTVSDKRIADADKTVYPECFKYFAKTKYIFTPEFINEFSKIITNPLIPELKKRIKECIITVKTPQGNIVSVFNDVMFKNQILSDYQPFMTSVLDSSTFETMVQITEKEVEKSADPNRQAARLNQQSQFNQTKKYITLVKIKSKMQKRSSSCPKKKKSAL